jgi:hypothetical protein
MEHRLSAATVSGWFAKVSKWFTDIRERPIDISDWATDISEDRATVSGGLTTVSEGRAAVSTDGTVVRDRLPGFEGDARNARQVMATVRRWRFMTQTRRQDITVAFIKETRQF